MRRDACVMNEGARAGDSKNYEETSLHKRFT